MYTLVYKLIDFLLTEGISVGYVSDLPKIVQSWDKKLFTTVTNEVLCGAKWIKTEEEAGFFDWSTNEIWLNMNEVGSDIELCEIMVHELCHWLIHNSDAEVSGIVEEDICLRAERLVSRKEAISLE